MNKQAAIKWLKDAREDCTSGEDEPYKEALGIGILAIQHQLNNGWIPVDSMGLPDKTRRFNAYVTMKHKEGNQVFSSKVFWEYGEFKWFNGKSLSDKWIVFAWRPEILPEPYKEVSE
ncbi:MAG TPA: hypothetical protein VN258_06570 [Mobilitalea sp.]|nr:hypothetical protein [Mobilitalea sp.]